MTRRRLLQLVATVAAVALGSTLTACGFQLRGAYALPFATLYIGLPETAELHATLKRNIEAASPTRIVGDPKAAQAILNVVSDVQNKTILSLDSAGNVREYQLARAFKFRLQTPDNQEILPVSQIVIYRDISFSNAQVLSKESEETLLWRDIQNDLVQQLLRRLAVAKVHPAAAE